MTCWSILLAFIIQNEMQVILMKICGREYMNRLKGLERSNKIIFFFLNKKIHTYLEIQGKGPRRDSRCKKMGWIFTPKSLGRWRESIRNSGGRDDLLHVGNTSFSGASLNWMIHSGIVLNKLYYTDYLSPVYISSPTLFSTYCLRCSVREIESLEVVVDHN